ncbi:MAG: ectoine/hydroxyectoine ABC transporter permease subunit EhuC [Acetobacteraceae bacterium]|nr:ectoine/hydroxyectoine ABC transporter permease subunit EhuC [Acetobacteraceae bacterium]
MDILWAARFQLLLGLSQTVRITLLSLLVAGGLSFLFGIPASLRSRPLRWAAVAYIELFRGVALVVQLFWLFFVLPFFGIELAPLTTAVLGLGLCNGAYGAEIVRGAIAAVPAGQREAAASLGLGPAATLWRVVLPQALPATLAPFNNQAIELLKATALVSLITIPDLAFQAQTLRQTTMRTAPVFLLVLAVYFVLAQVLNLLFRIAEPIAGRGLGRGGVP